MNAISFQEELHLHLYGCLKAEDVWKLGRTRWEKRQGALVWYADEYEKAWGRRPKWETYWTEENGLERLKEDYLFLRNGNFHQFQACFNLLIALFPLSPEDDSIIRYILQEYSKQNISYAEFRIPFGMSFVNNAEKSRKFLSMIASVSKEIEQDSQLDAKMVISLPRNLELALFHYSCLQDWKQRETNHHSQIVGVDFCGYEEDSKPEDFIPLFERIKRDNLKYPEKTLSILYHVGESFQTIPLEESIRRIKSAHDLGVHRLGHALSLGIDTSYLQTYDKTRKQELHRLQEDTMDYLREREAVIESCPISNCRIGNIEEAGKHPLKRFLEKNLRVVISSDDPGIFNSSLQNEIDFSLQNSLIEEKHLSHLSKIAYQSRSFKSEI